MTRTAKPQEWTPFDRLLWQIARDRFFPIFADEFEALKLSWNYIFGELQRNAFGARTTAPESYRLIVTQEGYPPPTGNAIDLLEGGLIHRDFWGCFWEAHEVSKGLASIPSNGTWCDRRPDLDSFEFVVTHPGRLEIAGAVRGVEVRIFVGDLARSKPGRKPKSKNKEPQRDPVKFTALMAEAAEKIARGEDQSAVVKWARDEVKARGIGKDHTAQADTQAIRRDLKERGLWSSPA